MSDPLKDLLGINSPASPTGDPLKDILSSGGNPVFIDTDNPFQPRVRGPDNAAIQTALSFAQGALQVPQGLLHTANKVADLIDAPSETLQHISTRMDQFAAAYAPVIDSENDSGLAKTGRFVGNLAGNLAAMSPVFKVAGLGVRALGAGAEALAPNLTARILTRISNAGRYAEQIAAQGPEVIASRAGKIGQAVAALPGELAAGTAAQAAVDPESLSTPKGVATSIALGTVGSYLGAENKLIGNRVINTDDLPAYQASIRSSRSPGEQVNAPDVKKAASDLRTNLIDKDNPLLNPDNLGGKGLYKVGVRNSRGTSALINQFNEAPVMLDPATGDYVPTGNIGINQIQRNFLKTGEDVETFNDFLTARRQLELNSQNRDVRLGDFSDQDAQLMVDNAPQNIKDAAGHYDLARQDLINFVHDRGVFTDETTAKFLVDNPNYAPMFRQVIQQVNPGFFEEGSRFGVSSLTKKIRGVTSDETPLIRSPIENIRDLNHMLIKAADSNEVGQELYNRVIAAPQLAEQNGFSLLNGSDRFKDPEYYSKVAQVRQTLDTHNIPDALGQQLNSVGAIKPGDNITPDWYTDKLAQDITDHFGKMFNPTDRILSVKTAQGTRYLQLNQDMAKFYENLSPKGMNFLQNFASGVAGALKTGTTANPVFGAINAIRDSFDATIQSQYGFKFGVDSWKGFMESLEKGPYAGKMRAEWMANGGGFSTLNKIGSEIKDVSGQSHLVNAILHPIDALKELTRPFEEAARLGEYIKGREQGATAVEAALSSRKVTTDFAQIGASTQALSQMTAFLNPGIQSLDQNYQSLFKPTASGIKNLVESGWNRDVEGVKDAAKSLSPLMKGMAAIGAPSALLWLANRNDQEIQDLRKTPAGATSWFVRLPSGEITKIPKPFLYGQIFGTGIETALDGFAGKGDEDTIKRFASALLDQAWMNAIPNVASLPTQIWANKDQYSGSAIIPDSMQGLDPSAQTLPNTTGFAKNVTSYLQGVSGGKINISPIYVDWLARNVGGSLAKDVTSIPGTGTERSLGELPFTRRFFADPASMNVEPIQKFYKNSDEMSTVLNTLKFYEKSGQIDKFQKYLTDHQQEFYKATYYAETRKQLADLHNTIEQIQSGPFSPAQKKQYIDYITKQAIEVARGVNVSMASQ